MSDPTDKELIEKERSAYWEYRGLDRSHSDDARAYGLRAVYEAGYKEGYEKGYDDSTKDRPPFTDEHVERLAMDMYHDGEEPLPWDEQEDQRLKEWLRTLARQRLNAAFGVEGETA